MNKSFVASVLAVAVLLSGCISMSPMEKVEYDQLSVELQRNALQGIEKKDPSVAAGLNVLPGIGNIYLNQWGLFVGNLLLWPVSIAWAAPQGYIDAMTVNKQETLVYYKYGMGKEVLNKRLSENNSNLSIKNEKIASTLQDNAAK